jgi:threonine dehydratase
MLRSPMGITLDDIRSAADAIAGSIANTPCLHSRTLSNIVGAEVFLKFENHQFTASFKERGALNKLLSLSHSQRAQGVIAASAGNHAQGVAYHAKRLGIPAVIVMPRFTPYVKVENTRVHGAEVVLHGDNFDEARAKAAALARERDLTVVHPYDDDKVIAGMAIAAKGLNPKIEVIGVQTMRFPSMYCALRGERATFGSNTIAEGIAVKQPGSLTLPLIRSLVQEIVLVDEGDIEAAIVLLLEIEKTVVEGAGAAGLAALLKYAERFRAKRVGLVLCGGNIDPLTLADIIQRGMVRSGRLAQIQVELRDLPGSLAEVTACLAEANANIEEVHHQRAFTNLPVQSAEVDFVLETRGPEHIEQILEALGRRGFKARLHNADR